MIAGSTTTDRQLATGERAFPTGGWGEALDHLAPVDLRQLDVAQLHDRVESKVILNDRHVGEALGRLADEYRVLEHDGLRTQHYRTEYFDDLVLGGYHDHHNQKANRIKVRYRTYMNSDLTYFEIKRAVGGRTVKDRRRSTVPIGQLWPEDALFVHELTGRDPLGLFPSLTVDYDRILLVRHDFSERVTIDLNVHFTSEAQSVAAAGLAICEFKQARLDRSSPAITAMERRPQMFSKYCMGLASCHPSLRRNRFKKVFRNLDALDVSLIPHRAQEHSS